MKIQEMIAETANTAGTADPKARAAIGFLNIFLPEAEKLPESATGNDMREKIAILPKAQQDLVLDKDIESPVVRTAQQAVSPSAQQGDYWQQTQQSQRERTQREKSWRELQMAHSEADREGNSTRPKIALIMAYLVAFMGSIVAIALFYAVAQGDAQVLASLGGAWEIITFALATPTLLLRSYFGLRTSEKKSRYAASVGQQLPKGFLESLMAGSQR